MQNASSTDRRTKQRAYYAENRERLLNYKKERAARRSPEEVDERKKYMSEYRRSDEYKAKRKTYRSTAAQSFRGILACVRQRAKKQKIPYRLTINDIAVPKYCPVLGIELKRNAGHFGPCDTSPSVDKLTPKLGYIPGNVRIISNRANRLKGDCTDPMEMIDIANDLAARLTLQRLVEMAVM